MVSVLGTATNAIDRVAAGERQIVVRTTPAVSDIAVAEHTLALMLALGRQLPAVDRGTRSGTWPTPVATELYGKTLGIVGLGSIGRRVAVLARAFGMNVNAWSRSLTADKAGDLVRSVSLEELLRGSDVISVHVRLSPETRGLLSREKLALLPKHAHLINTARAEILDEEALREMLATGRLGGAALDVFSREPLPSDDPWTKLDNVILTSHRAWITHETIDRLFQAAVDNVLAWIKDAS
jgi:phosphoglycerate dehydrogenase-like enzyme